MRWRVTYEELVRECLKSKREKPSDEKPYMLLRDLSTDRIYAITGVDVVADTIIAGAYENDYSEYYEDEWWYKDDIELYIQDNFPPDDPSLFSYLKGEGYE